MKIQYTDKLRLSATNKKQLQLINTIIEEYRSEGYRLTLRQLYYQLVSRDVIENKQSEYSKLSTLLTKGRMAGVVDWDAIEDRLRVPDRPSAWESPREVVEAAADQYRRDRMQGQDRHIEVWVEKDALSGVLRRITHEYGVNLMINRGYSSTSAMHDSYERIEKAWDADQNVTILYLGDHDPSGLDMVRDIKDRISTFATLYFCCDEEDIEYYLDEKFEVRRVALTTQQIEEYNPPPNPAKVKDPRAEWYIERFGPTSWEVDALPPPTLLQIVRDNIARIIDQEMYEDALEREEREREMLKKIASQVAESTEED